MTEFILTNIVQGTTFQDPTSASQSDIPRTLVVDKDSIFHFAKDPTTVFNSKPPPSNDLVFKVAARNILNDLASSILTSRPEELDQCSRINIDCENQAPKRSVPDTFERFHVESKNRQSVLSFETNSLIGKGTGIPRSPSHISHASKTSKTSKISKVSYNSTQKNEAKESDACYRPLEFPEDVNSCNLNCFPLNENLSILDSSNTLHTSLGHTKEGGEYDYQQWNIIDKHVLDIGDDDSIMDILEYGSDTISCSSQTPAQVQQRECLRKEIHRRRGIMKDITNWENHQNLQTRLHRKATYQLKLRSLDDPKQSLDTAIAEVDKRLNRKAIGNKLNTLTHLLTTPLKPIEIQTSLGLPTARSQLSTFRSEDYHDLQSEVLVFEPDGDLYLGENCFVVSYKSRSKLQDEFRKKKSIRAKAKLIEDDARFNSLANTRRQRHYHKFVNESMQERSINNSDVFSTNNINKDKNEKSINSLHSMPTEPQQSSTTNGVSMKTHAKNKDSESYGKSILTSTATVKGKERFTALPAKQLTRKYSTMNNRSDQKHKSVLLQTVKLKQPQKLLCSTINEGVDSLSEKQLSSGMHLKSILRANQHRNDATAEHYSKSLTKNSIQRTRDRPITTASAGSLSPIYMKHLRDDNRFANVPRGFNTSPKSRLAYNTQGSAGDLSEINAG